LSGTTISGLVQMCFLLISTDLGDGRDDFVTADVGRVTRLLMVLGLGLAAAQWIGARLRRLRHESGRKADALLASNGALIRPILLTLGLTLVGRIQARFRRPTAHGNGSNLGGVNSTGALHD
jgi:hypothetical protein